MATRCVMHDAAERGELPVQILRRPRCPRCETLEVKRHCTKGRLRYYACLKCETRFKVIVQ